MIDYTGRDQSWWPDLTGQTAAILASGPSVTPDQCAAAIDAGWFTIAINNTWQIAPKAHTLYACDWHWWRSSSAPGPKDFRGQWVIGHMLKQGGRRFLMSDQKWREGRIRYAPVLVGRNEMIFDGDQIGSGSNSAFQAANLAVRWGARRIVLIGVDCHSPGRWWHPPHSHAEAPIVDDKTCRTWLRAWRAAAKQLSARGVEVVNCSPGSAVRDFPKVPLRDLLEREAA